MLKSHYYEGKIEAGCDEAGRGCLAGSVYAAAVIFPEDYQNEELNDSKQLTDKMRCGRLLSVMPWPGLWVSSHLKKSIRSIFSTLRFWRCIVLSTS